MSVVKNDLFNSAEKSCPSKYSIDTFESIQSVQTGLSQLVYGFDVYNCLNLFCFYYSPFFSNYILFKFFCCCCLYIDVFFPNILSREHFYFIFMIICIDCFELSFCLLIFLTSFYCNVVVSPNFVVLLF